MKSETLLKSLIPYFVLSCLGCIYYLVLFAIDVYEYLNYNI